MKVKILPHARKDLSSIAHYTQEKWGKDKRAEYLQAINSRIKDITFSPEAASYRSM